MTLRDTMARDARKTLTRLDHFGEVVTYVFKSGAPDLAVNAVVDRLDIDTSDPNVVQVGRKRAHVAVPFHSTEGVTAFQQGDRIRLAMRLGEDAVDARIKRIVSQDEGLWIFEVEA